MVTHCFERKSQRQSFKPRSASDKRGYRKIHFADSVWQYRISGSNVHFISPDGIRYLVDHSEMTGMSWEDLERADWKGYYPQLTPSFIKEWIETNYL
jgi:hypothetical protein